MFLPFDCYAIVRIESSEIRAETVADEELSSDIEMMVKIKAAEPRADP